jgi:hypothetical protein
MGVDLTANYDSAEYTLGALHFGSDGVYQYVQADASGVALGEFCFLSEAHVADEVDTTNSGATAKAIGCANQVALAASKFGWVFRGCGTFEGKIATGVAADANLTTTATAGVLGAGGDTVIGLRAIDANASGVDAIVTLQAVTLMATNA